MKNGELKLGDVIKINAAKIAKQKGELKEEER